MNAELEARIAQSTAELKAQITEDGRIPRDAYEAHVALLRQRTPADHDEMARARGLPPYDTAGRA